MESSPGPGLRLVRGSLCPSLTSTDPGLGAGHFRSHCRPHNLDLRVRSSASPTASPDHTGPETPSLPAAFRHPGSPHVSPLGARSHRGALARLLPPPSGILLEMMEHRPREARARPPRPGVSVCRRKRPGALRRGLRVPELCWHWNPRRSAPAGGTWPGAPAEGSPAIAALATQRASGWPVSGLDICFTDMCPHAGALVYSRLGAPTPQFPGGEAVTSGEGLEVHTGE